MNKSPGTDRTSSAQKYQERVRIFQDAVKGPTISLGWVRELAFDGIPEVGNLRAIIWRWEEVLKKKREMYQAWVRDLIIDPHDKPSEGANGELNDHPLSTEPSSTWNAYFKDQEMLFEIDKAVHDGGQDVRRTLPHLHFFNNPVDDSGTKHAEALKRILFIYAKLNPGIKYVQGMNEIVAPIYYVFSNDSDPMFKDGYEADVFHCFTVLMGEVMNNFIKTLDGADVGISGLIARLNQLLKNCDHELWHNLEDKKLHPQFYSFRWLTLLLSQEFQLPDVLRLWDSLFADPRRFEFLIYFCCAMLLSVKEQLMKGDFAENVKLLQNYPPIDFNVIFQRAKELRGL